MGLTALPCGHSDIGPTRPYQCICQYEEERMTSPLRPGAGPAPEPAAPTPKRIYWLRPDDAGISHSIARLSSEHWGVAVSHCGRLFDYEVFKDPQHGCPRCFDVREGTS